MSVIRFQSVSKAYRSDFARRRKPVLHEVDFEVQPGETFAYLGHNGAGKSTSVKAMLGLIKIDDGRIEVFGEAAGSRAALSRLGYLPESPYFYDHLSGREFLQLATKLCGVEGSHQAKRIETVLELVEMRERADERLRNYSKGMLQRIGLAQALVHDPELLILDEPMGGLDPGGRAQMRRIVEELSGRGKTIFLCSHILGDVEAIATRAAILSAGRLRRIVDLQELRATARGYELQCVDLPEALQHELGAQQAGAGTIVVPVERQDELPSLIARVDGGGGKVLAVQPRRQSLEELFLHEVGEAKPGQRADELVASVSRLVDDQTREVERMELR